MSMRRAARGCLAIGAVMVLAACDNQSGMESASVPAPKQIAEGPNLGVELAHGDFAAWDIAIGPDGSNLPPGGATAADGEDLYIEQCASCHGMDGEGGVADRLVGGVGSLGGDQPVKTVASYWPYATTLFDFIRRAMPLNAPQTLSDNQVYALSAHILAMNGLIAEDQEMNAETLPAVEMPNREGFIQIYPGTLESVTGE
jgi:S-disulfanyl-L-cysteine oxidoreductase SoxD